VVRWVLQTISSAQLIRQQIKQCASQLVRLALFYEYQRKVIRRDLIFQKGKPMHVRVANRKVIPPNSKSAFNIIFARAQTVLRQNFGMELYEMRQRGKGAGAVGPDGDTQTLPQTQTQKQKKKQARPSRLDVIGEEEEEEDEEEAEEEQAVAVVKREIPSIAKIDES